MEDQDWNPSLDEDIKCNRVDAFSMKNRRELISNKKEFLSIVETIKIAVQAKHRSSRKKLILIMRRESYTSWDKNSARDSENKDLAREAYQSCDFDSSHKYRSV